MKDIKKAVYDVGFHIVPSMSETEANEYFAEIVKKAEARGAEIILLEKPQLIDLAYTIRHHKRNVSGLYDSYAEGYMSSIKCEMPSKEITAFAKELSTDNNIVRALCIESVRNSVRSAAALASKLSQE